MAVDKKMSKLGEWAKDKPLAIVIITQQTAVGVEACFEFRRFFKAREGN